MFIFFSNDFKFILGALVIIGSGLVAYFVRDKLNTFQKDSGAQLP